MALVIEFQYQIPGIMITLEGVNKKFEVENQIFTALEDIHFHVKNGEFASIIGPSGCGKSTLLRIIAGLQSATAGQIKWEVTPRIGFVFQNYALFPYLTVYQNIEFGMKMNGTDIAKREQIVHELMAEIGLTEFADKHPHELSGGMRQRVGIARSLAIDPNVLLLDEPFSSLDEFTAETLRKMLLDIWQKRKITVIMVTHLVRESLELSDKIIVMSSSPGRVKLVEENRLPRPRNTRSQEFFTLEDKLVAVITK